MNATVFAYGQTGSGKTYTMGSDFRQRPINPGGYQGIIPQALSSIFSRISQTTDTEFNVRVGFVEIHKEEIRDLLSGASHSIHVRELSSGDIVLAGATEREVNSQEEMLEILERGTKRRATAETGMNKHSSRSHAIFTITIEQRKRRSAVSKEIDAGGSRENFRERDSANPNPLSEDQKGGEDKHCNKDEKNGDVREEEEERDGGGDGGNNTNTNEEDDEGFEDFLCAKMHLVDLAGSERAKRTKAHGARLEEGIKINEALFALGNVINALAEGKPHVPYRDSKLTRMLQDSLGGNSRTLMIACVSPAGVNLEETLNTLKYASRARAIKNRPVVNRDPMSAQIAALRQQLAIIQAENIDLRRRLGISTTEKLQIDQESIMEKLYSLNLGESASHSLLAQQQTQSYASQAPVGGEESINGLSETEMLHVKRIDRGVFYCNDVEKDLLDNLRDLEEAEAAELRLDSDVAAAEGSHRLEMSRVSSQIGALQRTLDEKQAEMSSQEALRTKFEEELEKLAAERDALAVEHASLQEELKTLKASSTEERLMLEKHYKDRLKKLEDRSQQMKLKESKMHEVEAARQRAMDAKSALQQHMANIKIQKVNLQRQAEKASKEFNAKKREMQKEIQKLQKEARVTNIKLQRLKALQEVQQGVIKRKTEEANAARRRLETLENRRAKSRTRSCTHSGNTSNAANGSPDDRSKISFSSQGEEKLRTIPTEQGEGPWPQPECAGTSSVERSQSSHGLSPHQNLDSNDRREGHDEQLKGNICDTPKSDEEDDLWSPRNAKDLDVTDPAKIRRWIDAELDSCTYSYDLRTVLEGEKAMRSSVAKQLREVEKRLAAIRNPGWWNARSSSSNWDERKLLEKQTQLKKEQEIHSKEIADLQIRIINAHEEEEKRGEGAAYVSRWVSLPGGAGVHRMLCTMFLVARQHKAHAYEAELETTELREQVQMLRLKLQVLEAEKLQALSLLERTVMPTAPAMMDPTGNISDHGTRSLGRDSDSGLEIIGRRTLDSQGVHTDGGAESSFASRENTAASSERCRTSEGTVMALESNTKILELTPEKGGPSEIEGKGSSNQPVVQPSEGHVHAWRYNSNWVPPSLDLAVTHSPCDGNDITCDDSKLLEESSTSRKEDPDETHPSMTTPLEGDDTPSEKDTWPEEGRRGKNTIPRHLCNRLGMDVDLESFEAQVLHHLNTERGRHGEPKLTRPTVSALKEALGGEGEKIDATSKERKISRAENEIRLELMVDYYESIMPPSGRDSKALSTPGHPSPSVGSAKSTTTSSLEATFNGLTEKKQRPNEKLNTVVTPRTLASPNKATNGSKRTPRTPISTTFKVESCTPSSRYLLTRNRSGTSPGSSSSIGPSSQPPSVSTGSIRQQHVGLGSEGESAEEALVFEMGKLEVQQRSGSNKLGTRRRPKSAGVMSHEKRRMPPSPIDVRQVEADAKCTIHGVHRPSSARPHGRRPENAHTHQTDSSIQASKASGPSNRVKKNPDIGKKRKAWIPN